MTRVTTPGTTAQVDNHHIMPRTDQGKPSAEEMKERVCKFQHVIEKNL